MLQHRQQRLSPARNVVQMQTGGFQAQKSEKKNDDFTEENGKKLNMIFIFMCNKSIIK